MVTIYGVDKDASFEEIGAIELLRSQGVDVQVIISPEASNGDLHAARLILSHFNVDVVRYATGAFSELDRLFVFGRSEVFDIMRFFEDKPLWVLYSPNGLEPAEPEINALRDGLIDEVFTKSAFYAVPFTRELVMKADRGVEHKLGYAPFCNPDSKFTRLAFNERTRNSDFVIIQDSPDLGEFCFQNHWRTSCKISVAHGQNKKVRALNWGVNKIRVAGNIGATNCKWNGELECSVLHRATRWEELADEYNKADIALNFYPAEEPFAFQTAKAMLSGVAVVAGATRAHRAMIKSGSTGFLARTDDEAAYLASRLSWEPFLRSEMATRAYTWFVTEGPGNIDNCLPWWRQVGVI